jgi:tetratricopeptide (TPR) repeat protein
MTPSLPIESQVDHWVISADGSGRGGFDPMAQRNTHMSNAGVLGPFTWTMPPAMVNGRRPSTGFGAFWTIFDQLRKLGQAMPPAALLPVLIAHTHALRLIAANTSPPARAEVLLLAGRFAEQTGWLAQESGDDNGALWWTDRAVEFAAGSGDRDLAAYALVRRGLVAIYRYDAHEAIAVARRAQAAQCGPRVRGLAALREAQGHALAGGYDQCRRALDQAAVLLQESASSDGARSMLGSSTIPDLVAWVTGWCLHDLGRSRQAIDALERQLIAVPDHAHRTLARIGVRYSLALVGAGELEHACTMVDRLLEGITAVDSASIRVDLRRLAQELTRRHSSRAVKEVMPRLVSALSTADR